MLNSLSCSSRQRVTFFSISGSTAPLARSCWTTPTCSRRAARQVLLIGTDGLWETQNASGEMFGKERLKALISRHAGRSAEEILASVIDSLAAFRNSARQEDDITLVVVKADS